MSTIELLINKLEILKRSKNFRSSKTTEIEDLLQNDDVELDLYHKLDDVLNLPYYVENPQSIKQDPSYFGNDVLDNGIDEALKILKNHLNSNK